MTLINNNYMMPGIERVDMQHVTNEMRLTKMAEEKPLVTGDEKIAVFGAAGQIGTKLVPVLQKLYPRNLILCDTGEAAEKKGMKNIDITDETAVRNFLTDKENNVKVVINLAALLSAVADQKPALAHKINFDAPLALMKIMHEQNEAHKEWEAARKQAILSGKAGTTHNIGEEPHTIRKLQIMSSMASQEFDAESHKHSPEIADAMRTLQANSSTLVKSRPEGRYGQQKNIIESEADYYVTHWGLDISIPCLAGVLNAHTPWPSNGTTEELDKLVVAAALHKVYGEQWESKLRELIIAKDGKDGEQALAKGHYLYEHQYVPEVPGSATFGMIDGSTLAEAVLMLLHKGAGPQKEGGKPVGAVHNVYEYKVRMMDALAALKELNPDFPAVLPARKTELKDHFGRLTGKISEGYLEKCIDPGKEYRAKIWPETQDTRPAEALIGPFKRFDPEYDREAMANGKEKAVKRSIRENYERAVQFFEKMKMAEMSVAVAPNSQGPARAAG